MRISTIDTWTLILWGKHAQIVPFSIAQAYNERIANSTMVIMEEASHSPQIDKPDEVGNAIADFLDNLPVNRSP